MENKIAEKPSFSWWVTYTLKKRNRIISKTNTKYWSTTHKYGARLPNNVTETMQIYQANKNTYWKDANDKDMKKSKISFKPIEECTPGEVRKWKVNEKHGYQ